MGLWDKKDENKYNGRGFTKLPNCITNSKLFMERSSSLLALYIFLLTHIVRLRMNDGLYIFENYYVNNTLACSYSFGYLSERLGVSTRTVKRWVKILEKEEVIKVRKVSIDSYRKQNVYILGTREGTNECFFSKEIYHKEKKDGDTSVTISSIKDGDTSVTQ